MTTRPGDTATLFASSLLHHVTLSFIVVTYLAIGTLYAVNTPAWQVPDEPAHYNYIRHIAQTGALPLLQSGDYDQAYLERLKSNGFPPDLPIDSVRYESYQPPLYYLLATPVFLLFGGALIPLRLFSLALGAGVILFAGLAVREVFPAQPLLALTTAGFIAFIPQHVAMMAGVNSDSLAELVMGIGLWVAVKGIKATGGTEGTSPGRRWKLGLGVIVGVAFLTKVTVYPLAVVAALAILWLWLRQRPAVEVRALISDLVLVFVPALLLGALYWGRNVAVYGWPDFLGAARHEAVVQSQPRTGEWIAAYGAAEVARRFAQTTFQSFWGQFGWMGVVMDQRVYNALGLYSAALAVGALIAVARRPLLTRVQRDGLAILGVSGLITLALYLYYNLSFVQHQGRYLFPGLIPTGLAAAVGIGQWVKWVVEGARLKEQGSGGWMELALTLAPIGLMAAFDVFALYRFIIPALR